MKRAFARSVVTCLCLAVLPAVAFAQASITGVVKDTSGAVLPGRDRRSRESGAHREGPHRRDRRHRSVPHHRTAARRLHRHLHAARLQHRQARRHQADRRVHRRRSTPSCASARSKKRSPSPAKRRSSTCRARRGSASWTRKPSARCRRDATCSSSASSFPASRSRPAAWRRRTSAARSVRNARARRAWRQHRRSALHDERRVAQLDDRRRLGRRRDPECHGRAGDGVRHRVGERRPARPAASASTSSRAKAAISITGRCSATSPTTRCRRPTSTPSCWRATRLLVNAGTVDKNWDFNPGFGGPTQARQDLVLSPAAARRAPTCSRPACSSTGTPTIRRKWTYEPDLSRPASLEKTWLDAQLRIDVAGQPEEQDRRDLHAAGLLRLSRRHHAPRRRRKPATTAGSRRSASVLLDWTSPLTNQVLHRGQRHPPRRALGQHAPADQGPRPRPGDDRRHRPGRQRAGLGIVANLNYRGTRRRIAYNNSWNNNFHYRFNVSYITGSHAFKVGMNNAHGYHDNLTYQTNTLSLTASTTACRTRSRCGRCRTRRRTTSIRTSASSRRTSGRSTALTVSLGHPLRLLREQLSRSRRSARRRSRRAATSRSRRQKNLSYQDITPKSQFAYDLFGNGKTALKVSLNKYLHGLGTTNGVTP